MSSWATYTIWHHLLAGPQPVLYRGGIGCASHSFSAAAADEKLLEQLRNCVKAWKIFFGHYFQAFSKQPQFFFSPPQLPATGHGLTTCHAIHVQYSHMILVSPFSGFDQTSQTIPATGLTWNILESLYYPNKTLVPPYKLCSKCLVHHGRCLMLLVCFQAINFQFRKWTKLQQSLPNLQEEVKWWLLSAQCSSNMHTTTRYTTLHLPHYTPSLVLSQ